MGRKGGRGMEEEARKYLKTKQQKGKNKNKGS